MSEKRLIDANALKANFVVLGEFAKDLWHAGTIRVAIDNAQTVEAVEVVHGCNVYDHDSSFECSVCGWGDYDTMTADTSKYNYCPNCGAKMDGDGNV